MSKGTRIPDNWQPDPVDIAKLRREFPGFNLAAELENFRDYWTAKAGAAATKMDWNATYRIWMRKAGRSPQTKGSVAPKPIAAPRPSLEPDHLLYFANRRLFEHLSDCGGIGAERLQAAQRVKWDTINWFRQPVLEGDASATPKEFVTQFAKALAKVSPLAHQTRKRWRKLLEVPGADRPFPPAMARPLPDEVHR